MKRVVLIFILLIAIFGCNSAIAQNNFTNNGASGKEVNCTASFKLKVKRDLNIETTSKLIDLGELNPGEVKKLGPDYAVDIKISGDLNSFVFTDIETVSAEKIKIKGYRFQVKYEENGLYSESLPFPANNQIKNESGNLWLRVFPEEVEVPKGADKKDYNLEIKIKCTYVNY